MFFLLQIKMRSYESPVPKAKAIRKRIYLSSIIEGVSNAAALITGLYLTADAIRSYPYNLDSSLATIIEITALGVFLSGSRLFNSVKQSNRMILKNLLEKMSKSEFEKMLT